MIENYHDEKELKNIYKCIQSTSCLYKQKWRNHLKERLNKKY